MRCSTLLIVVSACLAWPQVSPPSGPAGRRLDEWLKAINSGDRAVLREFFSQAFPTGADRLERSLALRQQSGGFDLQSIEESTPTKLTGTIKDRTRGRTSRLELEIEPGEPHRIVFLGIRLGGGPRREAAPPAAPVARMTEPEALAGLRAELERRAREDRFSGAVLVARNVKPVFSEAHGFADREKKVNNRLETKFRIGSMNKMFTAVAIAQLAQAEKLDFNDPVGKHLTSYPNHEVAAKVTIHHLLTHTGGTGDIFTPEYAANRARLREPRDYITLYGKRAPAFEPGSQHVYSNYGYVLLGAIVESVSGQSYFDYVRERIFKPAGMADTDSFPESDAVPNRSVGYTRRDGELRPNTATLPPRGSPAGGGYSTVEDLLRFARALLGHKLLSAEYTDRVTTGKVERPGPAKYGYGFVDHAAPGAVRWFGHGGGAPGMNGELRIYPESGYVVAALANLDPPAAAEVAAWIANQLPEK
jgi:CubicO group peptidase (beta-lactamase class C family)